jgi:small-conductance mechanosensitive channel
LTVKLITVRTSITPGGFMLRLAFTCALVLGATLGCRSKRASETANLSDTSRTTGPTATTLPEDTTPAVRTYSFDQRQEFAQSIRRQLTQLDQEIDQLAGQVKSKGGAVSDRAVANIRATRKTVDRELKRLDAATAANWEQVKGGVNHSLDRLNESIEGAQPK